jgi:hypothetical protein
VPIVAWTYGVVITRNPGIAVPGRCVGGSCVTIDRNWRRRSIIVAAAEPHSEKDSWTGEYATAGHQEKGKNFCFHFKLLAALTCKSFAKPKLLKIGVNEEMLLAFVHHCGGFKPPVRRVRPRPRV